VFSLHSPEYDERRDGYLPFGPAGAVSDPLQPVWIGSGRSAWHKPRRRRSTSSRAINGNQLGRGGQRSLKNHRLIDEMAASEMADRHDQPSVTVVVAKIELDGIRPSAAVPPFGMCSEPAPIKPSGLPKCAPHPASSLSRRTTRVPHPEKCVASWMGNTNWPVAGSGSREEA
jgi:hypothetical protein